MALTAQEEKELAGLQETSTALTQQEEDELADLEGRAVNRMPPEMESLKGFLARTAYKNLGTEQEQSLIKLKEQFPALNFIRVPTDPADPEGSKEVLAQDTKTGRKYKLDPEGLDWQDVTDIAWDTLVGIPQTAATGAAGALGAIAGGAPTGGLGAYPAGMGAASLTSGAFGSGAEYLRQQIGKYAGQVPPEGDPESVKNAGIVGMTMPFIFGGSGAKQALPYAKKIARGAINPEGIAKKIADAQKGILSTTYDAMTNKRIPFTDGSISETISSVLGSTPRELIRTAKKMLPQIRAFEQTPEIYTKKVRNIDDKVVTALKENLKSAGKTHGENVSQMDKFGDVIPTADIVENITELKQNLLATGDPTPATQEILSSLDSALKHVMGLPALNPDGTVVYKIPEFISASRAQQVKAALNDTALEHGFVISSADKSLGAAGKIKSPIGKSAATSLAGAAAAVNNSLDSLANNMGPEFNLKYLDTKNRYGSLMDLAGQYNPLSGQEKTIALDRLMTQATSRGATAPYAQETLNQLSNVSGQNMPQQAKELLAMRSFAKPSADFVSYGGTTSTSKTIPAATVGGITGMETAASMGAESPLRWGGAGVLLGSKLFSPGGMRKMMDLGDLGNNLGTRAYNMPYPQMIEKNLPDFVNKQLAPGDLLRYSPYLMMQTTGQEK